MTRKERAHLNGMIRGIKIMAFGAVMAVMCIIGLLLFLRPETSTLEKRDLAKFPEFSWADFADGTWFKGIDTWYADTYPLREPMIAVSQKLESLYGIRGTQIIDSTARKDDAIPTRWRNPEGQAPGRRSDPRRHRPGPGRAGRQDLYHRQLRLPALLLHGAEQRQLRRHHERHLRPGGG